MRNLIIIAAVIIAAWFIYSNYMPKEKPNNVVTQYADNLKTSVDKAEDAKKTANLAIVRDAITQFKSSENRNPESLQELVQKGFLSSIPSGNYDYDKNTGEIK
jgi:type VI protein secretion system component VasK